MGHLCNSIRFCSPGHAGYLILQQGGVKKVSFLHNRKTLKLYRWRKFFINASVIAWTGKSGNYDCKSMEENMKKKKWVMLILLLAGGVSFVHAGEDHSDFFDTSFETGSDVTRACLECHDSEAEEFMDTAHWLWKGKTPFLKNKKSDTDIGKINLMNDF